MMSRNEILSVLDELKVKYKRIIWKQIPGISCFATWSVPNTSFSGNDEFAEYKKYTLMIRIFYKSEVKDDEAEQLEKAFEDAVRPAAEFSKRSDFDDVHDLLYSEYTFQITEFFEEE